MSHAVVVSEGGVVQHTESTPDVHLVCIDWDEISETDDARALEYAKELLSSFTGLPAGVEAEYVGHLRDALRDRGLDLPEPEGE